MNMPNMLLEISGEITQERMKTWSQTKTTPKIVDGTVMKVKSTAVKSNIT